MRRRRPRRRVQASAAARGYGYSHQKLDKALRAAFVPGTACLQTVDGVVCGEPMWPSQELVLGHTDDRSGYIGLVHRRCNQRDAAIRGNRMRGTARRATATGMTANATMAAVRPSRVW